MSKGKVAFTAKNGPHERVVVGKQTATGRCARLTRFGQPITAFILSRSQERALSSGKRINIAQKSIARAIDLNCGLGGGARRRR